MPWVTGLLGVPYTMNQASYDLARFTRKGLIIKTPHRNLYTLTPDGMAFAVFYTKVHDRILRPLMATSRPPAPPVIAAALRIIDRHIENRLADARLPIPAAA